MGVNFTNQCKGKYTTKTQKVELYIFSDTSSKACGAAAYINVVNTNLKHWHFFSGKSKIAQWKTNLQPTTLRLELQVPFLASRIKLTVIQKIDKHIVDNIYL